MENNIIFARFCITAKTQIIPQFHPQNVIFVGLCKPKMSSYKSVGHVILDLHLGVGYSVLCQMEGVGHVFSNHHISTT